MDWWRRKTWPDEAARHVCSLALHHECSGKIIEIFSAGTRAEKVLRSYLHSKSPPGSNSETEPGTKL